jgi:hypothetical protein
MTRLAVVHNLDERLASTGIEQAKSDPSERADFTNCGNAAKQEVPVRRAEKKLTRVPFTVSRLMEFCTQRELVNQTGHDVYECGRNQIPRCSESRLRRRVVG